MKCLDGWKREEGLGRGRGAGGGVRRIAVRAGAALLLGIALFAGMAMAGLPNGSDTPVSQSQATAASPDTLRRDGDTIGRGQIIRFRVLAASNSPFDQAVKLKVRDAVLDDLRPELQGAGSEPAAAAAISDRLEEIRQVAQETVKTAGSDKTAQVFYGVTAFPAKAYGPVVYPAGNYEALKIVIGAGQGNNWWCVLFPPLCYVDIAGGAQDLSGGQRIAPAAAGGHPHLTTRAGALFTGARMRLASLFHK